MKKAIVFLLSAALSIGLFAGCSGTGGDSSSGPPADGEQTGQNAQDTSGTAPAAGDGEIKIMLIARQLSDPFSSWLMNMCEKELDEKYPEVLYKVVDQQADPANSQTFFDQALLEGYDAVIWQKVSAGQNADDMLAAAADEGLRVCIVNNPATDDITSCSYVPDYTLGKIAATYAAEHLPQNAKVVFYLGPPGIPSSGDRVQAYRDELFAKRPDIQILDEKNVELWSKDTAMRIMEDWCQRFPQIDAVLSVNDGMALGGIEALKADGRDVQSIQVYGIDGLADGCLSIAAGELTMTVLQDAGDMAAHGVDIAVRIAKGELEAREKYEVTPVVVDKENVQQYIDMHKANGVIQ